jgi:hypothetical protein
VRIQPIVFVWREVDLIDGDGVAVRVKAMVPLVRYGNVAARQFTDGEQYPLAPIEERSMASHSQFFAAMNEYFKNLPEKIATRWPTVNHFRRWCLIETNWFDEKEFELTSEKHARALATFIRTEDEYARIAFRGGTKVIVRRAKSQSLAAMGKADFEKSKKDVLDLAESLVGAPVRTVMKNAGKVA